MNFSEPFIRRPVATIVLVFAMVFFGLFAYHALPVNELPNVDFPTITVTASIAGAEPETMAATVATPLEKQFSSIAGIDSINSVNSAGRSQITLQFNLNRDIDAAAQDVQMAIAQASRSLPPQMLTPPTLRKANPAAAPILQLALTADQLSMSKLNDYAETYIGQHLSMIDGVAQVHVYGAQQYAVRIHVNPYALAARGLNILSLAELIPGLNTQQPSGTLQTNERYHLLKTDGQLKNADEFANAVIATAEDAVIHLKDIAKVEDSVGNDKAATWYNGKRAIVLAVVRQPGANTVAVVNNINKMLPDLVKELPQGTHLQVVYDRAKYIERSIDDVQYTLLFAAFLVVMVIYLFLRNFSATLITVLALPTSLIATFGIMYLLNYSLDNLSLMGLVLAVGFIIDDAVVVLENISRYMEKGLDRFTAVITGTKEISTTVVSMTISLAAVFIPILFMGGILGRLFHEFAVVVGVSILCSGIISLTLTPVLCRYFLTHTVTAPQDGYWFNRLFEKSKLHYETSLRWAINHQRLVLNGSALLLVATIGLFYYIPKGFIPPADIDMIQASIQAPEGISYTNFVTQQQAIAKIIQNNSNVAALSSSVGQGAGGAVSGNSGQMVIRLKPAAERSQTSDEIIQDFRKQLKNTVGVKVTFQNPPAIRIGGISSKGNYQYVLQGTNYDALIAVTEKLVPILSKIKGIDDVNTDLQLENPQYQFHILREQAAKLGISPEQIERTLYRAYGEGQITSINTSNDQYPVIMDIDPEFQNDINHLNSIYLRNAKGDNIPLTAVTEMHENVGPLSVNHYGQLPSVTLSFNLTPGAALSAVQKQIETQSKQVLPAGISGNFAGSLQTFQNSLVDLPLLLLFTILVIYLVLAILYEHFGHPLTILTALPFAALGALIALPIFHQQLDVFSFIGMVMLVGLVKKNGIMMIDFALEARRNEQLSAQDAIVQACLVRFRPIMMTTFAAILATLPIALGLGAGGEARRSLGIAVVGGLIFSQFLTLYVTPVFYLTMEQWTPKIIRASKHFLPGHHETNTSEPLP